MKSFEHTMEIAAPVSAVWAATVAIEAWPNLMPTVASVERLDDGALAVGSRASLKQPGQPARVWRVTELLPGERFVWVTTARGFTMTATHALSPSAGGTVNRLVLTIAGPLAGLLALVAGRRIRATLQTENESFAKAAA